MVPFFSAKDPPNSRHISCERTDGTVETVNRLSFDYFESNFCGYRVVPLVDGVSILDLVWEYESAFAGNLAGAYAGLPRNDYRTYNLGRTLLGYRENNGRFELEREVPLLGCNCCSDIDCWPLMCRVWYPAGGVMWSKFRQPHRKQWDYSGFGPFLFDRAQYLEALAEAARQMAAIDVLVAMEVGELVQ